MPSDISKNMRSAFSGRAAETSQDILAPRSKQPGGVSFPRQRLLRVQTEYFVAGAIWEKINGVWSCTHSAPILRWMRGLSSTEASKALLKMGAEYQWIDCQNRSTTNRNPVIHADISVPRINPIPCRVDATYEERHANRSTSTARTRMEKSKFPSYSMRKPVAHTVGRDYQAQGTIQTLRNRTGFHSSH